MIISGYEPVVGRWLAQHCGGTFVAGTYRTIAYLDENYRILSAVAFTEIGGELWIAGCAVIDPRGRSRAWLCSWFDYVFGQLERKRLHAIVRFDNERSTRQVLRLGFVRRGKLDGSGVYVLDRDKCKFWRQADEETEARRAA